MYLQGFIYCHMFYLVDKYLTLPYLNTSFPRKLAKNTKVDFKDIYL